MPIKEYDSETQSWLNHYSDITEGNVGRVFVNGSWKIAWDKSWSPKLYARAYAIDASNFELYFEEGEAQSGKTLKYEWLALDGEDGFLTKHSTYDILNASLVPTEQFLHAPWQKSGTKGNMTWTVTEDFESSRGERDDISKIKSIYFTDRFCKFAEPEDIKYWFWCFCGVSKIQNMNALKSHKCTSIRSLLKWAYFTEFYDKQGTLTNFVDFDTSNVTDMTDSFGNWRNKTRNSLSFGEHFDTSKVTTMNNMFGTKYNYGNIKVLDISHFKATSLTDVQSMFMGERLLTTIYASDDFDLSNKPALSYTNLFNGCPVLVGGNGTAYSQSNPAKAYARIDRPGTPGYFTEETEE